MNKFARFVLLAVGVLVLLVVVAAAALPLFLNGDSFRTRIETAMTQATGRKVTLGKVTLSVWSGGLLAENAVVADDPQFSTQPFLQAGSVKIRVEMLPLILRKEVRVTGFLLQTPKIQLIRAANGKWNYSTISSAQSKPAAQSAKKETFPNLTVGHLQIENGEITVSEQPKPGDTAAAESHLYENVDVDVKNFGFTSAFPFTVSGRLPGDATLSLNGTAGPINQLDAAETPFSAHLDVKHVDPLGAGLVDSSAGISGLVDEAVLDAAWSGEQMHVTKLVVTNPHLTVVQSKAPKQPQDAGKKPSTLLENLSVDDAEVKNGSVTLTTPGKAGPPVVYQQINAQLTNLTPKSVSPFTASAQLPGGGALSASGKAGPFNQQNDAATPVDAQVSLKHVQLATAGVIPPDAGVSGVMDLDAHVQSNGQLLNATGKADIAAIKLAKNGTPSGKPVNVQFVLAQNEAALTGQLQQATISVGGAVIHVNGTYQTSGPTTAVNLKVNGDAVSIDALEAFLPALGVRLPQGSRLQGGTLTTALTVSGSTASPVITGPVHLQNTQLAGFNLGAKLQSLSKLTGGRIGGATGNGTNVRSLSMNVRDTSAGVETDKIDLDVVGVGTATGDGNVSEAGALRYAMILKLTGLTGGAAASGAPASTASTSGKAGLAGGLAGFLPGGGSAAGLGGGALGGLAGGMLKKGIPVEIGGTTSNPTFTPNLAGLISGVGASAAQGVLGGAKAGMPAAGKSAADPVKNALGGFLGKH